MPRSFSTTRPDICHLRSLHKTIGGGGSMGEEPHPSMPQPMWLVPFSWGGLQQLGTGRFAKDPPVMFHQMRRGAYIYSWYLVRDSLVAATRSSFWRGGGGGLEGSVASRNSKQSNTSSLVLIQRNLTDTHGVGFVSGSCTVQHRVQGSTLRVNEISNSHHVRIIFFG